MYRRSLARRAPAASFSALTQQPLFPGINAKVKKFDGEHTFSYSAQNMEAMKESRQLRVASAAIGLPTLFTYATGIPLTALGPMCLLAPAYLVAVAAGLRIAAAGAKNTVTRDLSGKTVLLLGGTGDIGKEVAKELLAMRATVVIVSRSDEAKVKRTREYLKAVSGEDIPNTTPRLFFKNADLSYLSSLRFLSKSIREEHPSLHLIINCSGVMFEDERINKYGDEEQLSTNVLGPYALIESLLPMIVETKGRIVHVASSALVTCNEKVVKSYLAHKKGLWSPDDANHKFDGIEQYGFTKLCNLFHAQTLAEYSYKLVDGNEKFSSKQQNRPKFAEGSIFDKNHQKASSAASGAARPKMVVEKMKLDGAGGTAQQLGTGQSEQVMQLEGGKSAPASSSSSSSLAAGPAKKKNLSHLSTRPSAPSSAPKSDFIYEGKEPAFTVCAANPGGVVTDLFRNLPSSAGKMKAPWLYPFLMLMMKTPHEGAQTILYCALEENIVNGGYYQNCKHTPDALSAVACSKTERMALMDWVKRRTKAVMDRQASWKPSSSSNGGTATNKKKQ